MARYAVSDVHGCMHALESALSQVGFCDDDVLYVLGDMIDRGPASYKVLEFVRSHENVIALMGNHELMALQYLDDDPEHGRDWQYNGYWEMRQWFEDHMKGNEEQQKEADELISWLRGLPYWVELDDYLLIHAGWNTWYKKNKRKRKESIDAYMNRLKKQYDMQLVWSREEFYEGNTKLEKKVIFGHTPTYHFLGVPRRECRVLDYEDKMNIDCGCAYGGKLALLNLDTMEVVYTREPD